MHSFLATAAIAIILASSATQAAPLNAGTTKPRAESNCKVLTDEYRSLLISAAKQTRTAKLKYDASPNLESEEIWNKFSNLQLATSDEYESHAVKMGCSLTLTKQERISGYFLPEGKWSGAITYRTIPDVDKDGEWNNGVELTHCGDQIVIRHMKEDGNFEKPRRLAGLSAKNMYILSFDGVENADHSGWVESQVWTLVDARPNGWTLGLSRAVVNPENSPTDPWFTFRRFGFGNVVFDPSWCEGHT